MRAQGEQCPSKCAVEGHALSLHPISRLAPNRKLAGNADLRTARTGGNPIYPESKSAASAQARNLTECAPPQLPPIPHVNKAINEYRAVLRIPCRVSIVVQKRVLLISADEVGSIGTEQILKTIKTSGAVTRPEVCIWNVVLESFDVIGRCYSRTL